MGRLSLTVWTLVTVIAVGGVVSARGAMQTSANHGPTKRGFSAFAVNPRSPQVVYAGTGSGVFKSTDGGASWRATNAGLTERYVMDLAIDQHHAAVLYAATSSGVFKSTNGARSWGETSLSELGTVALALHPRNSRVLYAGTEEGVYKSSDAGARWRKVTTDPHARRVFAIALDPQHPATVYAG